MTGFKGSSSLEVCVDEKCVTRGLELLVKCLWVECLTLTGVHEDLVDA